MSAPAALAAGFTAHFGAAPSGTVFAPGRVNLIGDHVDYNDGLVLPMPIATGTWIAWSPRSDNRIAAVALDYRGEEAEFALDGPCPAPPGHWASYLFGMARTCAERDLPAGGINLAILGTMPRGAGLSSSASLCVAIGRAFAAAAPGVHGDPLALARAAQATEHDYAGVRCGIMDQIAVALGQPGDALLLDCRDLAIRHLPLPEDWAVMVVQSGVQRGLVDGQYNQRRRDCEDAAQALGLGSLRDAALDDLDRAAISPVVARRARHVITEIARTRAAAEALGAADLPRFGALLRASHASLRDAFEVSVPAVDGLVDWLNAAIGPVGGARMTGGGFGGAVVAVMPADQVLAITAKLAAERRTPGGAALDISIEGAGTMVAAERTA